jgi:hypothetical protein
MPKHGKRVKVTVQNRTGRNLAFVDKKDGTKMTRVGFVKAIKCGDYPDYDVRVINGISTPVSKPDKSEANNLG